MRLRILLSVVFALLCLLPGTSATSSRHRPKATVSFKETNSICETTSGVKSYAGYVRLPASNKYASYEQNIFFWFFEARTSPKQAPLTIWLQGGPGMGSTSQALGGNGPCRVQSDSKTTVVNEHSWNTHSNMLYIDQPVQAGFSYDAATPGKLGLLGAEIYPDGAPAPDPNDEIFIEGTFGSQNLANTANTTANVAEVLWDFMQIWMDERKFKNYRRDSVAIWTQSYGGHWAPGIATHFLAKSAALTRRSSERSISISHLGIFSGVFDFLVQGEYYPTFAVSNTYDIEAYPSSVADAAIDAFERPGGCGEQAAACQKAAITLDPENTGAVETVQRLCAVATMTCWFEVYGPFEEISGLNPFDITQTSSTQFPEPYANGFLNREEVQMKLGVNIAAGKGVNYTNSNGNIFNLYIGTGDFLRKDSRLQLGDLLDQGIPVTLAYGDRDFRANWYGGEALSTQIPFDDVDDFAAAGYADFSVGSSVAGKTRQAGLLSFTRVFQAGHEVPYYNPAATHALFTRALQNKDVPTGSQPASASNPSYATTGPASVRDVKAAPAGNPGNPSPCYVMNPPISLGQCSAGQIGALLGGTAEVEDFVVASV